MAKQGSKEARLKWGRNRHKLSRVAPGPMEIDASEPHVSLMSRGLAARPPRRADMVNRPHELTLAVHLLTCCQHIWRGCPA